jgi:hypothetical protein
VGSNPTLSAIPAPRSGVKTHLLCIVKEVAQRPESRDRYPESVVGSPIAESIGDLKRHAQGRALDAIQESLGIPPLEFRVLVKL